MNNPLHRILLVILVPLSLAACVSPSAPPPAQTSAPQPQSRPASDPSLASRSVRSAPRASSPTFRVAPTMNIPGLENVIGQSANRLEQLFGRPQLRLQEGDALKLQFSDEPCVLDIYLYPERPGAAPKAAHVEARRASDGRPVDRASCVAALRRR